jgi:hypothetical protein
MKFLRDRFYNTLTVGHGDTEDEKDCKRVRNQAQSNTTDNLHCKVRALSMDLCSEIMTVVESRFFDRTTSSADMRDEKLVETT